MASAWLIRRFIDPHAPFAFGEPGARRKPGTITFDIFEGDFTHEGDRCTFEVLRDRFGLRDSRLDDLAELVHDLDLKDGRYGRAEASWWHEPDTVPRSSWLGSWPWRLPSRSATPPVTGSRRERFHRHPRCEDEGHALSIS